MNGVLPASRPGRPRASAARTRLALLAALVPAACAPAAPAPPPATALSVAGDTGTMFPRLDEPAEVVDYDADGVLDEADACPATPEDPDGFSDGDGCPDGDNDGDGIADAQDRCRDAAEVLNGVEDADGCPDQALARVDADRIVLEDTVHFEFGTAVLRLGSRSVLEDVARLLLAHPEYARVEIRGYADPQGDPESNLRLSQRRAERIRDELLDLGVEAARLTAIGFGEEDPVAPGLRIIDNRQNRRVEFVITEIR